MSDQAQSGYYQTIAKEFLGRRGAPFFLSPRDLAVIHAWEKDKIPLPVVLEGVGRVFDGLRSRARGTKGLSLSSCETQVRKALAQHMDRIAGRRRAAAPRSRKAAKAKTEIEACLKSLPADERALRPLLQDAAGLLAGEAPDEEALEKIDEAVDGLLWSRASRAEREGAERRTSREFPGRSAGEIASAARIRLIKSAREERKIPYASLFYY
ncbi:MAG: hypothetical protein ABFD80_13735 [Acidobacteriota bacterium]